MAQKREKEEKQITDMLCAAEVQLEDLPFTVKGRKTSGSAGVIRAYSMTGEEQMDSIDTIVNSASPDLMGGEENTVDWLLHKLIDGKLAEKGEDRTFNQKICGELAGRNAPVISEEEECISRIRGIRSLPFRKTNESSNSGVWIVLLCDPCRRDETSAERRDGRSCGEF